MNQDQGGDEQSESNTCEPYQYEIHVLHLIGPLSRIFVPSFVRVARFVRCAADRCIDARTCDLIAAPRDRNKPAPRVLSGLTRNIREHATWCGLFKLVSGVALGKEECGAPTTKGR